MDPQPYSLHFNAFITVPHGQWAGSLRSVGTVALPPEYAVSLLGCCFLIVSLGSQTLVLHHFADKCYLSCSCLHPCSFDQGSLRATRKGFYAFPAVQLCQWVSPEFHLTCLHVNWDTGPCEKGRGMELSEVKTVLFCFVWYCSKNCSLILVKNAHISIFSLVI